MGPLKAEEVIERVQYLENDQSAREMRDQARGRHNLHSMLYVPDLPEHVTRGDAFMMDSPRIAWLANTKLADVHSYPITTTVIPTASVNAAARRTCDDIEQAHAIIRDRLDDGHRVSHSVTWHQLVTGYAVMWPRLTLGAEPFPGVVDTPDPLTCVFPIEGGPVRPSMIGARFLQLCRDTSDLYGGRKRTEHYDEQPGMRGGKWRWEKLSDDRPTGRDGGNDAGEPFGGPNGRLPGIWQDHELIRYADPDYTYHVALNEDRKGGLLVWCGKNRTGGTPAVIVPGHITPLRAATERFQPALWAPMQAVLMINVIRALWAAKSFTLRPDALVEQGPDVIKALKDLGALSDATNLMDIVDSESGGPQIINVQGKPMVWQYPADPYLQQQYDSWNAELRDYIDTALAVTTDEVLKNSTANGILMAVGVRKRQDGPFLSHRDWAWREVLKMVEAAVPEFHDDFELFARGGERWGKGELKAAASVTLTAEMLKTPHDIVVTTEAITQDERRALVQDWAYRKSLGIARLRDGLNASGIVNEEEYIIDLAKDAGLEHATAGWEQQIDAVVQDRIRLSGGVLIQLGVGTPSAPAGAAPNMLPTMQPPSPAAV